MNRINNAILLLLLVSLLTGCSFDRKYHISRYYSQAQIDTLTVNMVTYIGRKPITADWQTRHDPVNRQYYINLSRDFRIVYYHIGKDGLHYYYMIRPARTVSGTRRGVGGTFRLEQDGMKLTEFKEEFNTPVRDESELIAIGRELLRELISSGNVDRYLRRNDYIEWPDGRLQYDRIRNEWRYNED